MTKETWIKHIKAAEEYSPKHAARWYNVYRVLSAAGPEEYLRIQGLEAVRNAVIGCWDWEVRFLDGTLVDDRIVLYS